MKNQGFTMIEIVVTISMLLLASSILIGTVIGVTKRNEKQKLIDVTTAVVTASQLYVSEYDDCPATVTELVNEKLISKDMVDGYVVTIPDDPAMYECETAGEGFIEVEKAPKE